MGYVEDIRDMCTYNDIDWRRSYTEGIMVIKVFKLQYT